MVARLAYRKAEEGRSSRMLQAAPHRGNHHDSIRVGSVEIGVSNRPGLEDASLFGSEGYACAFCGRLDNEPALLGHLGRPPVRSARPAETVLAAYRAWGDGVWGRLRGDFAVVVSDGSRLRAARDHLGSSTLFYRVDADGVYVASEAKQVAAGAGISRQPNFDLLHRAFFGEEDPYDEPTVMIAGVERIPRASYTVFTEGVAPRSYRYWDPTPLIGTAKLHPFEVRDRLVALLEQAAERVVTGSDVVALSGGIDSPVVAAFAAPVYRTLTGRALPALSTVYPHAPTVDETPYIEAVVRQLGLDWHTFIPGYRPLNDLSMWVDLLDGPLPTADVSAMAEFFEEAGKLGARTVLMGELAELVYDLRQHVVAHLLLSGRLPTAWRHVQALRQKGRRWPGVVRAVLPSLAPPSIVTSYVKRKARDAAALASWIEPGMVLGLDHRWDLEKPARRRFYDVQGYFAMAPSVVGIEASSICAAHFGMHLRRPLIDLDLWEFFLSLPAHLKFPDAERKSIVREAARGRVPDIVLDRQDKTGFTEDVMGRVDYGELRRWMFGTDFRMKGIDYAVLAERLEQRDADFQELIALNRLASIHAFVGLS